MIPRRRLRPGRKVCARQQMRWMAPAHGVKAPKCGCCQQPRAMGAIRHGDYNDRPGPGGLVDCTQRPKTRLHPTQRAETSRSDLQRGSHPDRTFRRRSCTGSFSPKAVMRLGHLKRYTAERKSGDLSRPLPQYPARDQDAAAEKQQRDQRHASENPPMMLVGPHARVVRGLGLWVVSMR